MKKIIALVLFSAFLFSAAFCQQNENQQASAFLANGVPVYYKQNTTNAIDVVRVNISGGIFYYSPELAGIENATLSMCLKGSKTMNYQTLQQFCYQTSSSFGNGSGDLNGHLRIVSISKNLSDSIKVLADCFLNPGFDKGEYEKMMTEYLQSIQATLNDPMSLLTYQLQNIINAGHVSQTSVAVTPESIENITLENIKAFHKTLLDSRRLSIFAYTSMPLDQLVEELNQNLGTVKAQTSPLKTGEITPVTVNFPPLVLTHPSAANAGYVLRTYAAPSIKDKDYWAFQLANAIYSKIMFNVIRTKHGVCYTPQAGDFGELANVGVELLYSCTNYEDCVAAMAEARNLMAQGKFITGIKANGDYKFSTIEKQLAAFKYSAINSIYGSQQTSASVVNRMAAGLFYYNDISAFSRQEDWIMSVTAKDIQRVFAKYVLAEQDFWAAAVGPGEEMRLPFYQNEEFEELPGETISQ